ncbi:aspartyl/glutamyl-tRNA amidotransferase subunit A [Bowdeniella nasicola]|uniref:Glutamyl-tRNA(Gln) amidotransferase subunit A n=1 Tax=Bowdeniella nasicola TaxID=208480 RepID=A0A1Q5Q4P2_9ACTO|nr:Asp-tRNA(Asn)/Glu-tRNA(Gln) amidotransferase subunit GatA [Bowdeniella nasicola]OKL54600.1 aspartyl/glutamyl-tRNA amidotransferase subunit A [Bowdeniella nasicola]
MTEIHALSALDLADKLAAGELTSEAVTTHFLDRIDALDTNYNAFLHVDRDGALATAREIDERRSRGETLHRLAGVPIALKDNLVVRGMPTTCASKMLEGWRPPYDATVVAKIKEAGLPILGKTNLDEFAMGSSTENSAFGPTKNPWDTTRIPGGSGGGSAAAVAAGLAPLALGSDTGGSIRQPGAVTGTVGVKPTYGAISRYGLIAMASSLDQIGPVTRTIADAAALQDLISGHDPADSTSLPGPAADLTASIAEGPDLTGVRIGVVKQLGGEGYQAGVLERFTETVEALKAAGATISEVDCPNFDYALAAYYLIMPAEVSSNLARFDGMRYGLRVEPAEGPVTAERVMAASRGAGFGDEVKRRIILGTHALSAGVYDAYYGAALKVRTLVQRDLVAAFGEVDVLISPTAPTTAFKFGEKSEDLMSMYLNDVATIPANLAGIPALSVPCGLASDDQMPVGLQVLAPAFEDARMYRVAAAIESLVDAPVCPALKEN